MNQDSYALTTEENIFNTNIFNDTSSNPTAQLNDFTESFLIHCEFGDYSTIDPLRYKPEVRDLNSFELPKLLPALPG